MNRTVIILAGFLLLSASAAHGQTSFLGKPAPEIDVREWINTDEEISLARLRGRPVLLMYWGMRCTVCMCRGVLRKCVPLYKKHAKQGLVIVACHIHEATYSEIDALSLKYGIEFPMGNGGYNAAYDLKQVPRLFLLDSKGVVRWEGDDIGGDFTRKLNEALRDVDYMGETKLPKSLALVRRLVVQRKFGKAIEKLIDFRADMKAKEEDRSTAEAFQKKLEALGDRDYIRASSAIRTLNPYRGVLILERLVVEFKDHPVGRKAAIRLKELRKNEDLKPLVKAGQIYHQFRDLLRAGNFRGAASRASYLFQKHPKSVYAKMAANLLEVYEEVH